MYFPEIDKNGKLLSLKMIPLEMKKFSLHYANSEQVKWLKSMFDREGEKFGTSVKLTEAQNLKLNWQN
ncbi:hypothetical protein C7S20_02365 [Christiangramia fulva]|uniref:Uncharacterized protein n=1 Tax=Christiangramia fulva TaxID=2126553 RepID=A0A2R3Z1P7_9FLAO|nr:hypothetical protein [Christiangramia fulva]AVR44200.1 hypothetical protein C7S20_02365 [Christiangramia fulva]